MIKARRSAAHCLVRRIAARALIAALIMPLPALAAQGNADLEHYLAMPLEDLLTVEVSSVSRKKERLKDSAAAVYVVTAEAMRQMGATSIAEALRTVPGVQVARINSSQWAINIRGFSGRFTNKLLVLVDGRSVYVPSFSGVYWDELDSMIDDIERIEVIRGPGATLWGANAVNGVINIITRRAADTQGGALTAGAGSHDSSIVSVRYGRELSSTMSGRAYAKFSDHDGFRLPGAGGDSSDDWQNAHAGFRVDGGEVETWTLQGDIYRLDGHQTDIFSPFAPLREYEANGWNILGRWGRELTPDNSVSLQLYIDHIERSEQLIGQRHDTADVDFQHRMLIGERHDFIWGLGYRRVADRFAGSLAIQVLPERRNLEYFSAFAQDEITLGEPLRLILGSKFERNPFTGYEVQPNVRALWQPREQHTVWASVSRALRTPSRAENDGVLAFSLVGLLTGNRELRAEKLTAYELGYRFQPNPAFSVDVALFRNHYDYLIAQQLVLTSALPQISFANNLSGDTSGVELAASWQVGDGWQLKSNYSYLNPDIRPDSPFAVAQTALQINEGSPTHQLSLSSSHQFEDWSVEGWAQFVDEVPVPSTAATLAGVRIDSYVSLNLRIAWAPRDGVELSLSGRNLLDKRHLEFVGEAFTPPTEVDRTVFAQLRWEWR